MQSVMIVHSPFSAHQLTRSNRRRSTRRQRRRRRRPNPPRQTNRAAVLIGARIMFRLRLLIGSFFDDKRRSEKEESEESEEEEGRCDRRRCRCRQGRRRRRREDVACESTFVRFPLFNRSCSFKRVVIDVGAFICAARANRLHASPARVASRRKPSKAAAVDGESGAAPRLGKGVELPQPTTTAAAVRNAPPPRRDVVRRPTMIRRHCRNQFFRCPIVRLTFDLRFRSWRFRCVRAAAIRCSTTSHSTTTSSPSAPGRRYRSANRLSNVFFLGGGRGGGAK
jgi:hypothetical protein